MKICETEGRKISTGKLAINGDGMWCIVWRDGGFNTWYSFTESFYLWAGEEIRIIEDSNKRMVIEVIERKHS